MSKSALLIGCNYPGTSNQLVGCINDIINMYNLLTTEYGYLPQNIVMLYDTYQTNLPQQYLIPGQGDNTPTTQSQNRPTHANITAHLQQLTALSNSQTEIWFHYSGHGSKSQMLQGSGLPNNEEVIIPTDVLIPYNTFDLTKLYTADMFYAFIQTINSNCNTILLFDSCFSASMCELPYSFNYISNTHYKFQETTNKSHQMANHNIYMFSGSTDKQTSASVPESVIIPGNPSNVFVGAFTETFIQCLKENKYNISIEPLCGEICKALIHDGLTQHPILSTSNPNPKYMFKSTNISVPAPIPVHIHQPKHNLQRRRRKRNQINVTNINRMLRKISLRHFLLRLN